MTGCGNMVCNAIVDLLRTKYIVSVKRVQEKKLDGGINDSTIIHASSLSRDVVLIIRFDKEHQNYRIHVFIDQAKRRINRETVDLFENIGLNIAESKDYISLTGLFNHKEALEIINSIINTI